MAVLLDNISKQFAVRLFDVFYDSFKRTGIMRDGKSEKMVQTLDAMKTMFGESEKRPLNVCLSLPQSYSDTLNIVWNQLLQSMPSETDMIRLTNRCKRLTLLIENILIQHERLAAEAIKTLRTIRRVTKWTALSLLLFCAYFYIRKFHGYIFQSALYKSLTQRRLLLAFLLSAAAVSMYVYSQRESYVSQLATIS